MTGSLVSDDRVSGDDMSSSLLTGGRASAAAARPAHGGYHRSRKKHPSSAPDGPIVRNQQMLSVHGALELAPWAAEPKPS
jgi:hypothetical protein